MKTKRNSWKKIFSIVLVILVVALWVISITGTPKTKSIKDALKYGLDINGGVYVEMEADTSGLSADRTKEVMQQTKEVMEKRVNAMGVSEATVSIEGTNRLRIEMPGVKDAEEAIAQIGKTAQLSFATADGKIYLTGEGVKTASYALDDQNGGYKITIEFTKEGQKQFAKATEQALSGNVDPGDFANLGIDPAAIMIWLDDDVLTAPVVHEVINSGSCEITRSGGFSEQEASTTAALIRGGALPIELHEASSSVQSATIGAQALHKSVIAGAIGMVLIFVLMIAVYGGLGAIADVCLALYVLALLWSMAKIGAVMTLPGIAGIILGIGMAVDSNVIIFSRIREEIGSGRSIPSGADAGYHSAIRAVFDSQITTFIATVVLYELGSTSVKGFALTLMLSIIISILTAVFITQIMISALSTSKFATYRMFGCGADGKPKKLFTKQFDFVGRRKIFYAISTCIIIIGLLFTGVKGLDYGIDFSGGTMLQLDPAKKVTTAQMEETLKPYKLDPSIVYAGEKQDQLIIKTKKPLTNEERAEIVDTIEKEYGKTKVITSEEFGPTMSGEIKSNAIKSILIAAIGMLIYIIIRFRKWQYGAAAISGLAHDVLILISMYALFRFTVDNPFIAAILTIVGYSINDTIVIFDRIRENSKMHPGMNLKEMLNMSINQMVGRSLMTSVTTIIAIIPLIVMVSAQLAQFVIPLMIGIIAGTYSSIFICTPIYYELTKRTTLSRYERSTKKKQSPHLESSNGEINVPLLTATHVPVILPVYGESDDETNNDTETGITEDSTEQITTPKPKKKRSGKKKKKAKRKK